MWHLPLEQDPIHVAHRVGLIFFTIALATLSDNHLRPPPKQSWHSGTTPMAARLAVETREWIPVLSSTTSGLYA